MEPENILFYESSLAQSIACYSVHISGNKNSQIHRQKCQWLPKSEANGELGLTANRVQDCLMKNWKYSRIRAGQWLDKVQNA